MRHVRAENNLKEYIEDVSTLLTSDLILILGRTEIFMENNCC